MTTAGVVAQEISDYLVDQEPEFEYEHWSERAILAYMRDAIRILSLNFKGEFTRTFRVLLQPGMRQALPAECDEFVGVSAQVDKRGNPVSYLRRASSGTIGVLNVAECSSTGATYRARTYQFDSSNKREFLIEPPVPAEGAFFVELQAVTVPAPNDFGAPLDIPAHLIPALKELVLYYAYGVDQESVTARQYSDSHWQHAVALIAAERGTPSVNNVDTIKRE